MVAVLVPSRFSNAPAAGSASALTASAGKASLVAGPVTVTLPWWPSDVQFQSLSDSWTDLARPGRDPLVVREAGGLPEVVLGFLAARLDGGSVQSLLNDLHRLAQATDPVQLMLGTRDAGLFRVTDLSWLELEHTANGEAARADVQCTLRRSASAAAPVGPIKVSGRRRGRGRR